MIRTHATQLITALGPQNQSDFDSDTHDEDGDIGTMEQAISKLLRIVAHAATPGQAGAHVARTLAADADHSTKEWLATMVGDGVKADQSAVNVGSSSSGAALRPTHSFSYNNNTASSTTKPFSGCGGSPTTSTPSFAISPPPPPPLLPPLPPLQQQQIHSNNNNNNSVVMASKSNPLVAVINTVKNVRFSIISNTSTHSHASTQPSLVSSLSPSPQGSINPILPGSEPPYNHHHQQQPGSIICTDRSHSVDSSTQHSSSQPSSRPHTGSFGMIASSFAVPPGKGINTTEDDLHTNIMQPWFLSHSFGDGLSDIQKESLLNVDLETLHSFKLDVLALHPQELTAHVVAMFLQLDLAYFATPSLPSHHVQASSLWRFVDTMCGLYRDVPYHNFYHCIDVTHAVFLLIDRLRAPAALTPLECFALLVAALSHDLDHPGVNNAYLVNSKDPLALTYNDASVLENRHVACLYALIAQHEDIDIFKDLDASTWRDVRRMIIAAVLHTDMTQHFPMVSKLEVFLELKTADIHAAHAAQRHVLRDGLDDGKSTQKRGQLKTSARMSAFSAAYTCASSPLPTIFSTQEERTLLLSLILHCADISNPARSTTVAEKYVSVFD